MTLTLSLTMNSAFFTNSPTPANYPFIMQTTGAPDNTVTWQVTS